MKNLDGFNLFALNATIDFGKLVASKLHLSLSDHEEREFDWGEHKTRSLVNVRNNEVFVIQSLYGDSKMTVNDKLCRLLFFLGSLKDAGSAKVTAVVPYMCYMRKDRKTKSRDPVTTKYMGRIFEAANTDNVLTIDVHNLQAYQNGFPCHTEHLEAKNVFVDYFVKEKKGDSFIIMSPDIGGVKRAQAFRERIEKIIKKPVPLAFMEKQRSKGIVSGDLVVGDFQDKSVIIVDDLISSGNTLVRAGKAAKERGAKKVFAACTHGAFIDEANTALKDGALDEIVITNTIEPGKLDPELVKQKITILDISPLFAEAIYRIKSGGSIADLLEME